MTDRDKLVMAVDELNKVLSIPPMMQKLSTWTYSLKHAAKNLLEAIGPLDAESIPNDRNEKCLTIGMKTEKVSAPREFPTAEYRLWENAQNNLYPDPGDAARWAWNRRGEVLK